MAQSCIQGVGVEREIRQPTKADQYFPPPDGQALGREGLEQRSRPFILWLVQTQQLPFGGLPIDSDPNGKEPVSPEQV